MSILTISEELMARQAHKWAVAKAKAQLSAVINRALADGPQTITRSGRDAVIVVSTEDWKRKSRRQGNLADFFGSSPLRGARIRIKRSKAKAREIVL
jgi:prevent-host-death family protein